MNDILVLKDINKKSSKKVILSYLNLGSLFYCSKGIALLIEKKEETICCKYIRVYTKKSKEIVPEDRVIVSLQDIFELVLRTDGCKGIIIDEEFPMYRWVISDIMETFMQANQAKAEVKEILTRIQKKFSKESHCHVEFALGEDKDGKLFLQADTILVESIERNDIHTNAVLEVMVDVIEKVVDIKIFSLEVSFNRHLYVKNGLLEKGFDVDDEVRIRIKYHDVKSVEDDIVDRIRTIVFNYQAAFRERETRKRNKEFLAARNYLIATRQNKVDYAAINQLIEDILLPDIKERLLSIKKDLLSNQVKATKMDWHKEYYYRTSSLDNIEDQEENERMNRIMFDCHRLGDHTVLEHGYGGKNKGLTLGLILYCRYYSKYGFNVLNYEEHCEKFDCFEKDVLNAVEKKLFDSIISYERFEKEIERIIEKKLKKIKE